MGKIEITMRAPGDLIPYDRNARTHSAVQIDQVVASIKEFGWTNPILLDELSGVIAGHGRLAAAVQMGMEEVPCIVLVGLSKAQRKAYILADNKIALNAGWDEELLRQELTDLIAAGFDMDLVGFDPDEIAGLLSSANSAQDAAGARATLAERFMIPPFSVLNAREGWWQDRKRAWIALGIQSELGRGEGAEPVGSKQPQISKITG